MIESGDAARYEPEPGFYRLSRHVNIGARGATYVVPRNTLICVLNDLTCVVCSGVHRDFEIEVAVSCNGDDPARFGRPYISIDDLIGQDPFNARGIPVLENEIKFMRRYEKVLEEREATEEAHGAIRLKK